ncbi:MAG: dipeptidase [Lentimicrobiaceae bacterium]|nr:dipeptidase [Lentimicrobiaceae bacterium]
MEGIKAYVEANKERFLEELFGLIRIPSISSISDHKPDMQRAAEYWAQSLKAAGCDKVEIMPTPGNPVVYGEKIINPNAPTVLVYGHYDVMPVDPIDLWKSPPFEPEIRDGKIFARGADDDKGQAFMHAKAFEFMVKTGQLPCNVKFMVEGEEEVGSPNLGAFCDANKDMLKADIILVSDTSMIAIDIPSITVGLRGLAYMEVEVTGPNKDLHSGLFGGAVANPANILAKMISQLMDENNRITIPGFYDDVLELTQEERAEMAKAPFNLEAYKKALDIAEVWGEAGYSTIERTGIRPTLDVNGIWGGYTGEGAKTVLPSKASAKISMRLVPHQDHHKIADLFEKHFLAIAPPYVKVKVTALHGGQGYVAPTNTVAYMAASKAVETSFGKKPVPVRSGGSIPIISTFEEKLGIKSILMGFGLESDAIHSPNENYPLENFYKGIETIPYFYQYFAEMHQA